MNLTPKEIKILNRAIEIRDGILSNSPQNNEIITRVKNEAFNDCARMFVKFLLRDYSTTEEEIVSWIHIIKD